MSRIVDTYNSGCQNSSFTNTQEVLNSLLRCLEDERSEEPVILHNQETCSGEGLEND